jgi:hypothetical protein
VNTHSTKRYIQFGAGFSVGAGWENYDNSPSLILTRLPIVGAVFHRLGAARFPRETRFGDIIKGPLTAANSCDGIYASHVLEHLSLNDMQIALKHTLSMLKPGGIFRLVVPDLAERARIYVRKKDAGDKDASHFFMRSTYLGTVNRPRKLQGFARAIFGNSNHLWMWDEPTMSEMLRQAGFVSIRRCQHGDSVDSSFLAVEDAGRFRDAEINIDELAIECRKPTLAIGTPV